MVGSSISLAGRGSPGTSQRGEEALPVNQYEFEGDQRKEAVKHSEPRVGLTLFSFMVYKFSLKATGSARQVICLCISQRCTLQSPQNHRVV